MPLIIYLSSWATMKKRILLFFLLATPLFGSASHIVGGEFELVHIQGFEYRLNLILYFDEKTGDPGAKDDYADVRLFRMSDNFVMMDVRLLMVSETDVEYTQPACSNGEIITSKLVYTAVIILSPSDFNHPGGYYVAWERCCRNYSITNIFSNPPPGAYAGQTFYLEFPPVVKNGVPFVDSTPRLFPPLNDFGCPHRPYYTNFAGTDDDGDSLVYSLVAPLNTRSGDALPPGGTRPRPYPNVNFKPPFSMSNIMGGINDLKISKDGLLTVTPYLQGLMAFAVKVEEFRDGVKIGETRRDFQMLIFDGCGRAVPPQIVGVTTDGQSHAGAMSLSFPVGEPDATRTVKVRVWDEDSMPYFDSLENVRIVAVPLNFNKDISGILPAVKHATLVLADTVEFTISFPHCPFRFGEDPIIGILAVDDACTLPLTDTLKITLHVDPPPNNVPYFTTPDFTGTLDEGDSLKLPFAALDDDNDSLVVTVGTDGFGLATAGMTVTTLNQVDGAIDGLFKWLAFCNIYDFTQRTTFKVVIRVEDQDECLAPNPAKSTYNLTVDLPDNTVPIIDSDLTANPAERFVTGITRRIDQTLSFTVAGTDTQDFLVLTSAGKGVSLLDHNISIAPSPATGNQAVNSTFHWDITCSDVNLAEQDIFDFRFIVIDQANYCRIYQADTLDVQVKVLPPINHAPVLSVVNNNNAITPLVGGVMEVTMGASIDLLLTGIDTDVVPDKDSLDLHLTHAFGSVPPEGFAFAAVDGTSPVSTAFTWTPTCSIFRNGIFENEYTFRFQLDDDHCITEKKDSVVLKIRVKDVDGSDARFQPPNFVSPNGDDKNDYYAMETLIPESGELQSILPKDNCDSRFEYVRIYNRWGKEMFRSTARDFRWFPDDTAAGVYYYNIKFTKKEYRGSLTVRY